MLKALSFGEFLGVELLKKCTPLWWEARFKVKMVKKHQTCGPLLELEALKKCTMLWREARLEVKRVKS